MVSLNCCLLVKPIYFVNNNVKNGLFNKKAKTLSYFSGSKNNKNTKFVCWVESEKRESEVEEEEEQRQEFEFEVDEDKAREALKQLDQQFQSISQKPLPTPNIKASDIDLTKLMSRRDITSKEDEETEFSPLFLNSVAGGLFLLTILYNIVFYKYIKPAVDLPIDSTVTSVETQIK